MIRAALAAALLVCGVPRLDTAAAAEPFTVLVHLYVERAIAKHVLQYEVEDEAAKLWRPYGVELEWSDGVGGGEAPPGLTLGAAIEQPAFSGWSAVLGQAVIGVNAPGGRSIHVSYAATEGVLGTRTAARPLAYIVTDREMARALGRVLAHEIGHVLLALPSHDRSGLMRASFSPADLADVEGESFRLSPFSIARLKSRVTVLRGTTAD